MKELIEIQSKLKVKKANYNAFGKYYYRNAEDILEGLKPLLKEQNCYLTLSDVTKEVGGRIYVEATVSLTNSEGATISSTASARESETKKGMDDSQITGAASSYARKYALSGLFAIDDTKDSDTTNTGPKKTEATQDVVNEVKRLSSEGKSNEARLMFNKYTFTTAQKEELKNE